ncbi:Nucleotidyltransferase domain protein [uncultured archaeon]|nr:Nucleotidyltransferase domain protein [uncultured archaeon]
MQKPKALQEFLKIAKQNHGAKVEKIILFGSYARGEATEESDIDILVITSGNRFEMQKNLSGIAVDILLKTGEYISAKAVSTEEYSFMEKIKTGFYQNIVKEGVVIG